MKYILGLLLISLNINATVMFLGNSNNKVICDGEEISAFEIKECKKIKALTKINICYFIDTNLDCKKLFKNDIFDTKKIKDEPIQFSRLLSFNTSKQVSFGIKRFSNSKETNSTIPKGFILKPHKNIKIDFNDNINSTIKILENGKRIYSKKLKSKSLILKHSLFKYNNKYTILINNESFDFSTLSKKEQNIIFQEIKKLTSKMNNSNSKLYIKSIIYDQYGLLYDRNNLLKGIQND